MSSKQQTATKYLMGTACAGMFAYGILMAFLGATLPELRARLGLSMERSGTLFSILYLAQIPMAFVAGPLIDRFGKKPVLVVGSLLGGAALAGVAYAPTYAHLVGLLFVLGLGGSFVSSGANTLVAELYPHNSSSALNVGHTFFGLGAVFFPLLVALLATRLGLSPTLWLTALLVGATGALGLAQSFPPAGSAEGFDWREARKTVLDPAVILLSLILFLTTGLLVSMAGWIRLYLEQECSARTQTSSLILTLFWTLISLGRLASSQIVKKVRGPSLVLWSATGMVVGLLVLAVAPDTRLAAMGIVVCGLSYAPIYPTMVASASTHFPKLFGTVFSILLVAGLVGGMVLPVAIGYAAKDASVRTGIWVLVGAALVLVVAQAIFIRYERRRFLEPRRADLQAGTRD